MLTKVIPLILTLVLPLHSVIPTTLALVSTPARALAEEELQGVWVTKYSKANSYGSPIPPWVSGAQPGWSHDAQRPNNCVDSNIPCLYYGSPLCNILSYFPNTLHCPHTYLNSYTQLFWNLTAAVQADDYITYGLAASVEDCLSMCDSVDECIFANTYFDVNGKNGSSYLTCSLFRSCHGLESATNNGGQTQPNGSVNFIVGSALWCEIS
ncbi:hypothetical protein BJ165DRAFT_1396906 [Panaeolus papilionaceus]|nr:hypothetical protein BJ165DRAFT_1396906 [Panaeolus papilionaceus]